MHLVQNFARRNLRLVLIDVLGLVTLLKIPIAVIAMNVASCDVFIRDVARSVGEVVFRAQSLAAGDVSIWINVKYHVVHYAIDFPAMSDVLNFSNVGIVVLLCVAKSVPQTDFVKFAGL